MNDLISRSKLLGSMDKRYNEKCNIVPDNLAEGFMQMEKLIKEQPIAYSVEQVVEELEEVAYVSEDVNSFVDLEDAIEIVKQGVIADDVCEWKLEDEEANLYVTGCEQRQLIFEGTPKENEYRYCPYCGKKIKVVE